MSKGLDRLGNLAYKNDGGDWIRCGSILWDREKHRALVALDLWHQGTMHCKVKEDAPFVHGPVKCVVSKGAERATIYMTCGFATAGDGEGGKFIHVRMDALPLNILPKDGKSLWLYIFDDGPPVEDDPQLLANVKKDDKAEDDIPF